MLLSSCTTTSSFKANFESFEQNANYPKEAYLQSSEKPEIIEAKNLDQCLQEQLSKWYWCVGYSKFNQSNMTALSLNSSLTKFCKELKAKVAIYSKEYTNTITQTVQVPNTQYHTYSDGTGMMRTYTTTTYTQNTIYIQMYDYTVYYFIQIPEQYKSLYMPGFSVSDLTLKDKEIYHQDSGVLISVIYLNTPAYNANFSSGDIITEINGKKIDSYKDLLEIKNQTQTGDTWNVRIIRSGVPKYITLIYE